MLHKSKKGVSTATTNISTVNLQKLLGPELLESDWSHFQAKRPDHPVTCPSRAQWHPVRSKLISKETVQSLQPQGVLSKCCRWSMSHWEQSGWTLCGLHLTWPTAGQASPSSTLHMSGSVPHCHSSNLASLEVLPPPVPLVRDFLCTLTTGAAHFFVDRLYHTLSVLPSARAHWYTASAQVLLGWMDGLLSLKTTLRACCSSGVPIHVQTKSYHLLTYCSHSCELREWHTVLRMVSSRHTQLLRQARTLILKLGPWPLLASCHKQRIPVTKADPRSYSAWLMTPKS